MVIQGDSQNAVVIGHLPEHFLHPYIAAVVQLHLEQSAPRERNAFMQPALFPHSVKQPRHMARIAPQLVGQPFFGIDLLQHDSRNDDFVVVESVESLRIMKQHICIQYEDFGHEATPPGAL
ncbi:hypothetical protein BN871_AI_01460 [Paenibacillus sp. P22]|nr:hypothetical protein BN871_AI_01460 [Paenibacillus sp. P22]